jgi:hypothetical protein
MSAALKLETLPAPRPLPSMGEPSSEPRCVTSAAALWSRLCDMHDREQLAFSVCLEQSSWHGRGRRRAPSQERTVIAFKTAGRVRVFDPGSSAGPLRVLDGAHDLSLYFDDAAGFSYVVVR